MIRIQMMRNGGELLVVGFCENLRRTVGFWRFFVVVGLV